MTLRRNSLGSVGNALDCNIVVNDFEFQLVHYVYFWSYTLRKGMNFLISPSYGLKWTSTNPQKLICN